MTRKFNRDRDFEQLAMLFDMARAFSSLGDAIGEQMMSAVNPEDADSDDEIECSACRGAGAKDPVSPIRCEECDGTGHFLEPLTPGAAQYVAKRVLPRLREIARDLDPEDLKEQIEEFCDCVNAAAR